MFPTSVLKEGKLVTTPIKLKAQTVGRMWNENRRSPKQRIKWQ